MALYPPMFPCSLEYARLYGAGEKGSQYFIFSARDTRKGFLVCNRGSGTGGRLFFAKSYGSR